MTIEIVNVTKSFSGFTLGPINLKLVDKNILVLIGPTGSGKSTLLNLIVGLIKPDSGSIYIDGQDITNQPVESRKIGYLFQNPSLFPHMNVYQNITFGLEKNDRFFEEQKINNFLDIFGISHLIDRKISELSGGEMQKISLARMLIRKPKIMLMDEPLAHLDSYTKTKMRIELRQLLKNEGVSGIYVTHFEDDIYALADYVSIIRKGIIEKTDTISNMLSYSVNNISQSKSISEFFQGDYNYLEGRVIDSKNGISIFKLGSYDIEILGNYPIDTIVGVLIKPEDIILAVNLVKTSARNTVKAKVISIGNAHIKKGILDVHLVFDNVHLLSRITMVSKNNLGIKDGDFIYVMFKATSPHIIREEEYRNLN